MKQDDGTSKGFGFVSFEDPDDAKRALLESGTQGLYVSEALTKEKREMLLQKKTLGFKKSTMYLNLFVKGYDRLNTTEDMLKEHFSNYGEVKSVKLTSNGFAFVLFNDRESARKAKEGSGSTLFQGVFLTVLYFEPKEIR